MTTHASLAQGASQLSIKPSRILLPLNHEDGHSLGLIIFALSLAHASQGEIIALHVTHPFDPASALQFPLTAEEEKLLATVPHSILTRRNESVTDGILQVAKELNCDLILLDWHKPPRAFRTKLEYALDPVIEDAPCDVILYREDREDKELQAAPQRILLTTAGGPHAKSVFHLAVALAQYSQGSVTLVTILPSDAGEVALQKASEMLATIVKESGLDEETAAQLVTQRVIQASDVVSAIAAAAKKHDIAFMGATNESILKQLTQGSMTEQLGKAILVPVVIIARRLARPHKMARRFWRQLDHILPRASHSQQMDTYARIEHGARATVDFYVLMLLSTIIAAMGLLLNSGAVIIGAMLVAPLMTPIMGVGMGVVQGDSRLLRVAGASAFKGILFSIVTAAILAFISPIVFFTSEIAARTEPNLFDLTVALAAGAAGAYSFTRKDLAAALPGVAIAAALVPPLCVVGICLATARWEAAAGAALLFGTNFVSISFIAALVYRILGFYPPEEETSRRELLRQGFSIILVSLFIVSIPLTLSLQRVVSENALSETIETSLRRVLNEHDLLLFSFDSEIPTGDRPLSLEVVVLAEDDPTNETIVAIDEAMTEAVGRDVTLRLVIVPTRILSDQ